MAARLIVARNSEQDIKIRTLLVDLDGRRIGAVNFGQQISIEIASGRHAIAVSNNLFREELEFEAEEGKEHKFRAGNKRPNVLAMFFIVLGTVPYRVFLEPLDEAEARPS